MGMTRHFLSEGSQERYSQARFDAIRTMGRIAKEESCQFMLVCGDTFESNHVDRKTVARALEALKEVPVPVFILPGTPRRITSNWKDDSTSENFQGTPFIPRQVAGPRWQSVVQSDQKRLKKYGSQADLRAG
ncbi:MAG: hypothetical protein HY574_12340 [candidate division NC10 bacterium]|nr:hypothetical protein [candidate division NC10 bacterium]